MPKKRGRGRPKKAGDETPAKMLGVRCTVGFLKRVDNWRKNQPEKPTQTTAVRVLAEKGLSTDDY